MKAKEIYNKIEFWLVTIIAAAFVLSFLIMSKDAEDHGSYWFKEYNIQYNFYKHLFIPGIALVAIFYCGYVFINKLIPEKKDNWTKTGSVVGLYLIMATLVSTAFTYFDAWKFGKYDRNDAIINMFTDGFTTVAIVFILFIAYYLLKEIIFNSLAGRKISAKGRSRLLTTFLVIACWAAVLIVFGANGSEEGFAIFLVGVPLTACLIFVHLRYFIPKAGIKRYKSNNYWWQLLAIIIILSIIGGGICTGITRSRDMAPIVLAWMFYSIIVVTPVCWYVARNKDEKEILQTALGSSEANLGFLRSQINPHFLFNALNTLYGTALQENADRTGEGIQKLGDMMRFMLHENMQEKISLTREVDYLNNYIDLQKLRTSTSPDIIIQTNIEEQLNRLDISPMLLIPFVENAFKHGISLQQPSFINVSLHTKENVLYFDVNNSVHLKSEYDPEKMKSGIGLQNVKQRLALLYPKKHELIIRESAKEFFVHLTINL